MTKYLIDIDSKLARNFQNAAEVPSAAILRDSQGWSVNDLWRSRFRLVERLGFRPSSAQWPDLVVERWLVEDDDAHPDFGGELVELSFKTHYDDFSKTQTSVISNRRVVQQEPVAEKVRIDMAEAKK